MGVAKPHDVWTRRGGAGLRLKGTGLGETQNKKKEWPGLKECA